MRKNKRRGKPYLTNPLKNMHDAIKPDLTMFLHYETLEEDGKK
ncbi:MAG: hypothetical protein ACLUNU_09240 [Anaerobutyricum soehngenii]